MFKCIFSIIFVCMVVTCCAHESNHALVEEIVANASECIVEVVDDKIYVNPARLFPTENGLFLHTRRDHYVAVPFLCSDEHGCYISVGLDAKITKPCPHCGRERISGAFKCRNPDCPSNRPKS